MTNPVQGHHIVRAFSEELEQLTASVATMGGLAESLVSDSIDAIVTRFGDRKYAILLALTFFFMALGGFFGILEEVIPLVPIIIALAYSLGWDSLTGLGISILAANVGFSTAVFNFFTIGGYQKHSTFF